MRIGVVSTTCIPTPPDGYGGERLIFDLCEAFAHKGHKVLLFGCEDSKAPPDGSVFTVPQTYKTFPEMRAAEKMWIDKYTYVLDSCEMIFDFSVFHTVATWCWLHDAPIPCASVLFSGKSLDVPNPPYNLVFYTQFHARWGVSKGLVPRAIIPQCLDTDFYAFREGKEDFFLFLGYLAPVKGAVEAIDAAKEAGVRLVVAGDTKFSDHGEIAKPVIEKCKLEGVEFVDSPTREQKRDLMQRALGIISPQKEANAILLTILETMACGGIPVASAVDAIAEDLPKEVAFLAKSQGEMAEAMRKVKEDPHVLDRKLITQWVRSNFDRHAIAERYLNLANEVVGGRSW